MTLQVCKSQIIQQAKNMLHFKINKLKVPDFLTCNRYDLHTIALYISMYRNFPTKAHHLPNALHPLKFNIKNNLLI